MWLTIELGGPQPVAKTNQDRAVFARWSEAHKTWKTAVAKARSSIKKAEKLKTTLQTQRAKDRQAEVGEAATAELQELNTPPAAIATKVNDTIVINNARIPSPIPGPSPLAVAKRLAQFVLPPPCRSLLSLQQATFLYSLTPCPHFHQSRMATAQLP
jgi:predicted membrane chloride channel (bestrophin family)